MPHPARTGPCRHPGSLPQGYGDAATRRAPFVTPATAIKRLVNDASGDPAQAALDSRRRAVSPSTLTAASLPPSLPSKVLLVGCRSAIRILEAAALPWRSCRFSSGPTPGVHHRRCSDDHSPHFRPPTAPRRRGGASPHTPVQRYHDPPLSSHNNIPTLSCTPLTPRQTSHFKSLTLMFSEHTLLIRELIEAHRESDHSGRLVARG